MLPAVCVCLAWNGAQSADPEPSDDFRLLFLGVPGKCTIPRKMATKMVK